jgi:hypothetical protein
MRWRVAALREKPAALIPDGGYRDDCCELGRVSPAGANRRGCPALPFALSVFRRATPQLATTIATAHDAQNVAAASQAALHAA